MVLILYLGQTCQGCLQGNNSLAAMDMGNGVTEWQDQAKEGSVHNKLVQVQV